MRFAAMLRVSNITALGNGYEHVKYNVYAFMARGGGWIFTW